MSLLVARDLRRCFQRGAAPSLDDVSLEIRPGEFVAVAGPSGSGKTTMLAILGGLDRPDAGQVLLEGQDLYARSADALTRLRVRAISFVFQSHNLLPTLTALENVALAVYCQAVPESRAFAYARRSLGLLGLEDRMARLPTKLSLGEQQRVAVARALAVAPKLLVADEPTASLDGANGERVLDALAVLRGAGSAVLLASHDERCLRRADRVAQLRDGRLLP